MRERAALPSVARAAGRDAGAALTLEAAGGRHVRIGPADADIDAVIRVRDPRAYAAVLARGSTGLAQSYADGWWESDDVTAVVRALFRLTAPLRECLDRAARSGPGRMLAALATSRAPSSATDRHNIAAHYDLSNELFALMLDTSMSYSCAIFESEKTTLEAAQAAKIDRLAAKLDLRPSDHVLEIGTGWGGLAVRLAERIRCRVTTTTISEAQRAYAAARVRRHGLTGRVEVLGEHYRDLHGVYDALVSVEMIEAVDWRHHDELFATCARLLSPNGRMGLQAITIADQSFDRAKHHRDFIRRLVFPGGCIPSVSSIAASVARTGNLRITDVEDIGAHYAETLRRWRRQFSGHTEEVADLGFDQRFRRLWHAYLCYCEAAFEERHVSDVQMVLSRPGWARAGRVRPC